MKSILRQNRARVALVIGNGINRYGGTESNSWQALLEQLALRYVGTEKSTVPQGVPFTEYFDLLELMSREPLQSSQLQGAFCTLMEAWEAQDHHRRVVTWAMEHDAPILTTNFDSVLSDAGACSLGRVQKGGFTDFYPWESCYSKHPVHAPAEQFGIWHVNGMKHYRRSIRLGLTHYMGSVERARGWLHKGRHRLSSGTNIAAWQGAGSWLQIVFKAPLLIFGLGLEENEVFFRWLLIERARYFKQFPDQREPAWYVHTAGSLGDGKRFFLEGVGIEPVAVQSYEAIYGASVWEPDGPTP